MEAGEGVSTTSFKMKIPASHLQPIPAQIYPGQVIPLGSITNQPIPVKDGHSLLGIQRYPHKIAVPVYPIPILYFKK